MQLTTDCLYTGVDKRSKRHLYKTSFRRWIMSRKYWCTVYYSKYVALHLDLRYQG
jgi:hypothetical protein